MTELPTGTVTFLFTDLEGSTRLLQGLGREGYSRVLADHHRLLRDAFARHGGVEVDTQGDAFFVAFRTARDAVDAAAAAQRALAAHGWPESVVVRVRVGLHTGEALVDGDRYVGVAVHRAARISAAGHGGQVLVSNATREVVEDELPQGLALRDLGEQRLKDIDRPVRLFQLDVEGLTTDFPPVRTEAAPAFEPAAPAPWWRRATATRGRRVAVAGALLVATAAAAAALSVARDGEDAAPAASDALAVLDAKSNSISARIAVGATPDAVAVGEGGVWVVNADAQTVSHVDPESHDVESFGTGGTPVEIAAGEGGVWVANGSLLAGAQTVGPIPTSVVYVDPSTRGLLETVALPREGGRVVNAGDQRVAVSRGAVWAIGADARISRIDPTTRARVGGVDDFEAAAIAGAGREVWAVGVNGVLARIEGDRVVRRVELPASWLGPLAIGEGAVWVSAPADGSVWRVELASGGRPSAIPVGEGVHDVAVGEDAVWAANPVRGTVVRIDPDSSTVTRTIGVGGTPRALAVGEGAVWVTVTGGAPSASSAPVSGALPRSTCGDVFYGGGGSPDLLIASDLPLRAGVRISAVQMSQAIQFVLRERGFRAGRFRVGYQSCDDSVARTGLFDLEKCAANAREYARHEKVVGIVGTLNSPCAIEEIPILNRARGGGLAMVSPSNSAVGLTRAGPGVPAGVLADLYPTGRRNYVRVFPTDDLEGAAGAQLADQLKARRVMVLHDGDRFFSTPIVESFRAAARKLGLTVVGVRRWDAGARSQRRLARAVAARRPDAVYLAGILDSGGGEVVRDLRAVLGAGTALIGTSGFTPIGLLFERAGLAARGMYVSILGLTPQSYGRTGMRFLERFGATQRGVAVEPSALYAAQAATVLLDAIGQSDGTRRSVIEHLFATRVRNGILGSFRFDRNGDTTLTTVTIVRAERPGGRSTVQSFQGASVDRVLTPPAELLGG